MMEPNLDVATFERSKPSPGKESLDESNHTISQLSKPDQPRAEKTGLDSIDLRWSTPFELEKGGFYKIIFKENSAESKWTFYNQEFKENKAILKGLKSDCVYIFRVIYISEDGELTHSDASDPIKTLPSPASRLFALSTHSASGVSPTKCFLSTKESDHARNPKAKTRKFEIGPSTSNDRDEKTIMLIGGTGTGKSTLIDGMVNYILGVNWTDSFRFTIVTLEEDEDRRKFNQAPMQSDWITCYKINNMEGSRIPYTLSIIDVPGFGDDRGLERDVEIVGQIRELLNANEPKGIITIDAICFVMKAADARLTSQQRYIFHLIMSLFGKDIENNMCSMITFSDGKEPPVFPALDNLGLPFGKRFMFNNSGLDAKHTSGDENSVSLMFWTMGMSSFENFFIYLGTMQRKSLRLTGEVLNERNKLQVMINNIAPKLEAGLSKMHDLKEVIKNIEDNKSIINANKNFTYRVQSTRLMKIEIPRGQNNTNCIHCNFTCHSKCVCPDTPTQRCCKMDSKGYCTVCPDRCPWKNHANTPYEFTHKIVEETKTFSEMREKYEKAMGQSLTQEHIANRLRQELEHIAESIEDMMAVITDCNQRLTAIALCPNVLTMTDHIDLMIENEKQQKKQGWSERIQSLTRAKVRAQIFDHVGDFSKQASTLIPMKRSGTKKGM